MTFSWQTRVLLAAASGAALALAFPNYNLPLLAWVAPAMLILASYRAPLAQAPLYGFIHGIIFYSMSVPWIDTVMLQYGGIDPWSAAGILAILALAGESLCRFSPGASRWPHKKEKCSPVRSRPSCG